MRVLYLHTDANMASLHAQRKLCVLTKALEYSMKLREDVVGVDSRRYGAEVV